MLISPVTLFLFSFAKQDHTPYDSLTATLTFMCLKHAQFLFSFVFSCGGGGNVKVTSTPLNKLGKDGGPGSEFLVHDIQPADLKK